MMPRHVGLVAVAFIAGCAKPVVRPPVPAFGDWGAYAAAARRYSGCWAVRSTEQDPSGDVARLIIVELDTAVVGRGDSLGNPVLRAIGRAGVPRYKRGERPAHYWQVASGSPDTVDIALGGLSYPGWRLTFDADSLVGRRYSVSDLGGVETDGGAASARRVTCS
jgi:hypothetical protein